MNDRNVRFTRHFAQAALENFKTLVTGLRDFEVFDLAEHLQDRDLRELRIGEFLDIVEEIRRPEPVPAPVQVPDPARQRALRDALDAQLRALGLPRKSRRRALELLEGRGFDLGLITLREIA